MLILHCLVKTCPYGLLVQPITPSIFVLWHCTFCVNYAVWHLTCPHSIFPLASLLQYRDYVGCPWSCISMKYYQMFHGFEGASDNWCTVGGDGGCRVGEVRASTTSPMPDHKGFELQYLVNFQKFSTSRVNLPQRWPPALGDGMVSLSVHPSPG